MSDFGRPVTGRWWGRRLLGGAVAALLALSPAAAGGGQSTTDLTELSLEELISLEVTSVSKKAEPRSAAATALYVITPTDLQRSGVTTLADALRMAPGTHVARIDSNKWAVSIRGFGSRFNNKLLVLMDGRTLYTPLFGGTFWDVQDTLLEDVERIEVIRGPGGTLWGANAMNGVINVITKSSRDTHGAYLSAGGGTEERAFGAARYGGRIGDDLHYRVYGSYEDRDEGFAAAGDPGDDWHIGRLGVRSDWDLTPDDLLTMQGEVYDGEAGQPGSAEMPQSLGDDELMGAYALGRWTRRLGKSSDASLQIYYDYTDRNDPFFRERRGTFDADAQHRFPLPGNQEIVWGAEYRITSDEFRGGPTVDLAPDDRDIQFVSGFVQDEIRLAGDRLRLTAGSKFEHNDFTGFEVQPSGRAAWVPVEWQTYWASISRAVRVPSRVENDVSIGTADPVTGVTTRFQGNPGADAEDLIAYEIGTRLFPLDRFFVDLTGFYNVYDDLITFRPGAPSFEPTPPPGRLVLPLAVENGMDGEIYGFEIAADVEPAAGWRLRGAYSWLEIDLDTDPGHADPQMAEGSSPQNQFSLRSYLDLPGGFELDAFLRYVDDLPAQDVDGYVTADVRLARALPWDLELSVVGQNLVESHHREFAGGTEVQRGMYGRIAWRP